MPRVTKTIKLPSAGIGCAVELQFHHYGPSDAMETAYIQASLHADEIPGLLVANHLVHLLDKADAANLITKQIVIVPYANPIGLNQNLLGSHIGRFSLSSGTNFNRDWIDIAKPILPKLEGLLKETNTSAENVKIIRDLMLVEIDAMTMNKDDAAMKKELFKVACQADIVLDLHCDSDAILHMYTHDNLWPKFADLATELESKCHILSAESGGNCFDEACSCPWAAIAAQFPTCVIPMACESTTVELRGESDVSDTLASKDAAALFRFLRGRGYIASDESNVSGLEELIAVRGTREPIPESVPLTGVDMIQATVPGVLAWRVKPGDVVECGQLLGEIVNVADPDAPRTPIVTKASGIVFGKRLHPLARPGEIIIKVAGKESLEWRKGNLLTSR